MPKIIPELRQALIDAARRRIVDGEHDITIRQVAADCGTAVGTVYNYFPSKEHLMASVMLVDWQQATEELQGRVDQARSVMSGLRAIDGALRRFIAIYRPAWDHYSAGSRRTEIAQDYHHMVVQQIARGVELLMRRFGRRTYEGECIFLAETLLILSQREEAAFDRAAPVLERIIEN